MREDFFKDLSEPCPVEPGTRIRLLEMQNDPAPIPAGSTGTVEYGNGAQMYIKWDNGRTLILLTKEDKWEVIEADNP